MYSTSPSEKKDDWIPLTNPKDDSSDEEVPTEAPEQHMTNIDKEEEPSNVEAHVVATTTEDDSSTATKDLKNEIKIIQELLPAGVVHQVTVDNSNDNDDHPVQKVLKQWSKSIEPLQKGMDEHVKKFQGAMDEHVKPHWEQKVVQPLQPHLTKAQEHVQKWQSLTSENLQNLSSSTRNLMEAHVQPKLESVKKGTVEGLETSKRVLLTDIPTHSKRALDEHLLPAVGKVKSGTTQTLQTISTRSMESYQTHVQPQLEKVYHVRTTYQSCYMGRAPGLFDPQETRFTLIVAEASLRAFGKILFCDNPVTGGCVWLAMMIGSPITALCSLSSVVSLLYIVKFLELSDSIGENDSQLKSGAIAVNAALVGAGASVFFHFDHPVLGWMGSWLMATFVLPPITLLVTLHCTRSWLFQSSSAGPAMPILLIPYNIVMIGFLLTTALWDRSLVVPVIDETATEVRTPHVGTAVFNGLSKVFLVQGILPGILIVGGTLSCSRIITGAMIVGTIFATLLGWIFGMPAVALNAGTGGYNAALTTAALAYYFEPSWTLVVVGVFVIVLCGLFEAAFAVFFWDFMGLPLTLTLGFCFATIAILMLDTEESCSRLGILKRIPVEELSTPEEYLESRKDETVNLAPAALSEEEDDFVPSARILSAEETKDDEEDKEVPSESTPLIKKEAMNV